MPLCIAKLHEMKHSPTKLDITHHSVPSSTTPSFSIPIKIHEPLQTSKDINANGLKSIILFLHGGIFTHGSKECHPSVAAALAESNVLITASFRCGRDATWKSGLTLADCEDVFRWIEQEKENRIGWSSLMLGLAGSSSGGFFALTLVQTLPSIRFCIPICPVAHPFKRAAYLRSCITDSALQDGYVSHVDDAHSSSKAKEILDTQLGFWEDDRTMMEAGDALLKNINDVPTLLILGSKDKNVPSEVTKGVQSWATRTIVLGGRGHEICDTIDGIRETYHDYITEVETFLDFCLEEEKKKTFHTHKYEKVIKFEKRDFQPGG